ncbi:[FeFe] hydrogenase, group A [Lachnospiraceae bacterium ZAX-1]
MGYITINNRKVPFDDEKNLLQVIRNSGINLPTFCYHSELSTYGACRMCVVEDERGHTFASCSETPCDGMVIYTNTPKLQHHRKMIVELLLSSHCRDCTTCRKSGYCTLQQLAKQLGIGEVRFENNKKVLPLDTSSPCIVRDPNKCILCGDCVRTCEETQGIGVLDFVHRGSDMQVAPAFEKQMVYTNCVGCGQCRVVCPTGAITIQTYVHEIWKLIADKEVRVVVQIAPAVRVAVGDQFGIPKGENSLAKLVTALRYMGFDDIYDTNFGADMTVMEESKELVERLKSNENLPLFTSCCPGWVKFLENEYPDMTSHLSTCKSPMQMFGALIKEEAKGNTTVDVATDTNESRQKRTAVVAIMPCTAKKGEILRPENAVDGIADVDYVLTTAEITRMIKEAGIDLASIEGQAPDMPFGLSSGAGAIFGTTGGVTEAVLRCLQEKHKKEAVDEIKLVGIRGDKDIKEATVHLGEREVRIAVVHGLAVARALIEQIRSGEAMYDFVEVMACKRGCIAGGGQPLPIGARTKKARMDGLYSIDSQAGIKRSDENPIITELYRGVLKGKEHKLLHNR